MKTVALYLKFSKLGKICLNFNLTLSNRLYIFFISFFFIRERECIQAGVGGQKESENLK